MNVSTSMVVILIRDDLKVDDIDERVQENVEIIKFLIPGVVVHSVYKHNPPNNQFEPPTLCATETCHT